MPWKSDEVLGSEFRTSFTSFVAAHLPAHALPKGMSDRELADAIQSLAENEISWNRALQAALIAADDHFQEQQPKLARESLIDFAATCPWKFFAQIALDQATNYSP